jgi:hypothetical protein
MNDFRLIPNPYIVGNPIEDRSMFFGRVEDFEFINRKVTGNRTGGIIVLCGSRRSGKTSILFQIKGGRLGERFLPVLVDMQSITAQNNREFLQTLASEVASALGERDSLLTEDFLQRLENNPLLAFNEFTAKVSEMLGDRNLILMFDEYELFESHIERDRFSADVLNLLAYWMENSEGIFFLFTGSDKLEERDPLYWDSFLGKALHRRISFLRRGDTLRLIHDPVEGLVEYKEGVEDMIIDLTAGQPFYTQVLCQSIVDHLNESGKNTVSTGDIETVVEEIIENPLPQMIFSWSALGQLEKISLSIIAELTRDDPSPVNPDRIVEFADREKIGYRLDPNKIRETVERLFYMDFIEKDPESDSYTFKMTLWRRWIVRMHSIWQVLDEIATDDNGFEEGIEPVSRRRRNAILGTAAAVIIIGASLLYSWNAREQGKRAAIVAAPDSTVLSVTTEPAGADVFLDRTLIGQSPVTAPVEVGNSALRVSLDGYREYEDSLRMEKDVPVSRNIELAEQTGSLKVESMPPGALIAVDGTETGLTTPEMFDSLSVNRIHTVRLSLPGFYATDLDGIEISVDSTVTVLHDFSRVVHPLTVISTPPGASIVLDGIERGTSPVSIRAVEEGRHELVARLTGHYEATKTIEVPAGNNQIAVTLEPLPPGILIIKILPYAELWIDGELKERDALNFRIELKPGIHTIELRHPDFGTVNESVEIPSGESVTKTYNLEKRNR